MTPQRFHLQPGPVEPALDPHPTPLPAPERVSTPGRRERLDACARRLKGCTERMTAGLARMAADTDSVSW